MQELTPLFCLLRIKTGAGAHVTGAYAEAAHSLGFRSRVLGLGLRGFGFKAAGLQSSVQGSASRV